MVTTTVVTPAGAAAATTTAMATTTGGDPVEDVVIGGGGGSSGISNLQGRCCRALVPPPHWHLAGDATTRARFRLGASTPGRPAGEPHGCADSRRELDEQFWKRNRRPSWPARLC